MRQAAAAASGSLPSASVSDRDRLRSSSVELASVEEWDAWLAENHEESDDVWLRIAKMKAEVETVRYPAVLDVALSWGWIDGQRLPLDETYFLQRFVRRRPRSRWSQVNCDKAERLIAAGRMHPPGLAEVDRAKSDGRWDAAYAPQSRAQVPADLRKELDRRPAAKAFFETLSRQNRYAILYRLQDAKRPETRARRLTQFVEMLERGETIHCRR
jgi:uncharacterized protein YdeI (YjbR/CyaY-like superfamily)